MRTRVFCTHADSISRTKCIQNKKKKLRGGGGGDAFECIVVKKKTIFLKTIGRFVAGFFSSASGPGVVEIEDWHLACMSPDLEALYIWETGDDTVYS